MATRSRPPSQTRSPIDQGDLGPFLPPATPVKLGEVSLERVTRLLLGLLGQVERLKQEVGEIKEARIETRTNFKNISQAVDVVRMGLEASSSRGPQPQRTQNPRPWKQRHAPYQKSTLLDRLVGSHSGPNRPEGSPPLPNPLLSEQCPASPISPSISASPIPDRDSCPSSGSSRHLSRSGQAWTRLNLQMFPTNQEVLSFLLMNMKDTAGAWAHPHLDQLGSHRAIIQTVEGFKTEFLAAFGDPDATRAAERKITTLTQSGTCADYITKFRTLAMELDWNNAALRGQFARGLHWEVSRQIATRKHRPQTLLKLQNAALVIDNALREERASHPPRDNKSSKPSNPARGTSTGQPTTGLKKLSDDPNFVSEEERNRRRAAGACHPIEEKGKAKETAKIGKDSEYQSGKEKNLEKAVLTFTYDGKKMTETFLICNTGSHAAILGLKWLDAHNPEIDWNTRTLSFPHTPPEHVAIAKEEEADPNPLEGVPSKYHQYAKEGPLNSPLYSMTDAKSATLKDWLRDELKAGKIRPSKSSISSPVMFVPKKDGSRCLVVDYCCLNNRTKKNVYPLPRPDDLMAQLRGAKVFTKLDLRWGYNNVRVKEGNKWKTAFRTKYSLYKSLDDATHTQHVHEVLRRLMDNQLFCKASKCTFHVTSVEYLGIIVSDKGFSLDKLKIQAVQEWPTPTKVKEVQLFLGFANFLRRFVANFSHMARPLHNLVKKDVPWKWDTKEQGAFQGLKDAITNAPVLCHADPTRPYFLETDASGAALGSILSQRQEDGRLHPLGFLSKSFKGAEQNYDTHDKELLAIIRSFEHWRIFLEGTAHPVTVALTTSRIQLPNCLPPRQTVRETGCALTPIGPRRYPPANQTMLPDPIFANVALVTPKKELQRQIEASLDQDESWKKYCNSSRTSPRPPSIRRAFKDYQMEAGLLFYQGRIVVPDVGTLRTDLLQIFHDSPLAGHPGRQRTLELVLRNYYWPGIRADTYWHVDSCETCQRIRKPKYAPIPPQPLELPSRPWQHVSYDMIVDLPKDRNNDSILVIVDSFTKYRIFIKCSKKLKAPKLAELFLDHVWKRHGMPEKTILDRGRVFNNKFLRALYKRLGIDPHFSLAYHPQSDGQTERVNPSIEHFLRAYSGVNQRDWTKWLPMAEFAYNNAVHSSTGKTPFKALYGWEPTLTPSNVPTDVPEANDLAQTMENQWKEVESALRQSKSRMTAGEEGSPLTFELGEEAWLDAKNINLKTLSPKLTEQRLGPFKVIEKISDRAYRLELPPTMRIHNVFYIGLLSKVKRDKKRAFENRPPPITVDGEEEYEVEGITDAEEQNGKWFFRVKWKGYGSEENTWEPRENLKNAEKFLEKYEKEMKRKALGAAKALKGGQCRRHN
ncbi:hypothetical protein RHS01_10503 [Rhizoctonia solani]|uniref:Uncharacterized protein n=1 Tax=Rhizoctonia solani TaxID=456999 RepID=A0A8H7I222_9AGAM|nr:hypothetical protein RHS01_10503 [Rhizoctonia solani]